MTIAGAAYATVSPVSPPVYDFDYNDSSWLTSPSGINIELYAATGSHDVDFEVASSGAMELYSAVTGTIAFDSSNVTSGGYTWSQQVIAYTGADSSGQICPSAGTFSMTFPVYVLLDVTGIGDCGIGSPSSPMSVSITGTIGSNFVLKDTSVTFPSTTTDCGAASSAIESYYGLGSGNGKMTFEGVNLSTTFTGTCT